MTTPRRFEVWYNLTGAEEDWRTASSEASRQLALSKAAEMSLSAKQVVVEEHDDGRNVFLSTIYKATNYVL